MPKVESSRTKSKSPTPPLSPHRVSIPISPTAAHRAHPIDSTGAQRSSPTSPRDRKRPKDDPTSSPTSTVPVSPAAPALAPAARAANDVPSRPALATAGQTASASSADSSTKKPLDKATDAPKVVSVADLEVLAIDPIDMEIFSQILELDEDDEEQSFSKSIVNNYYDQVVTTFKDLRKAIEESNLPTLSNLGHFLKGSSAALGVRKVQATCEKIQNVGKQRSEDGSQPGAFTKDEAIKKITVLVERAEEEFDEGKAWFDKFYPGGLGEADT
ncbi:hypothetical protein FRB99_001763 [Tulasnella sp. 403]|nr:hypothetical protein FRB99_001763 [Tulasnella sp. 403]